VLQTSASARIEPAELARAQQVVANISRSFDAKVVGQARLRETLLVGLLTGGHILLESVPGLAKTTAAQTVAEAVSAEFRRIQCTPDLLPSDIVGTQTYDAAKGTLITQLGPVHANIVLLDEINRSKLPRNRRSRRAIRRRIKHLKRNPRSRANLSSSKTMPGMPSANATQAVDARRTSTIRITRPARTVPGSRAQNYDGGASFCVLAHRPRGFST